MSRAAVVRVLNVALLLLASACSYDNGHVRRVHPSGGAFDSSCSSSTPAQSTIDVGRSLEDIDAGQGAGVFVKYSEGGHWQLTTSCDTLISNSNCAWDVIVTPEDGSSIENVVASDLEPDDSLGLYAGDQLSYHLVASTGNDLDGFTFDSDPGKAVMVDVLLGDTCALPYVFWIGDGALHPGAPTNPLILIPSGN
jgi:hypothetical protein